MLTPRICASQIEQTLKKGVVSCLSEVQSLSIYRWAARGLAEGIMLQEADQDDMLQVESWLNPGLALIIEVPDPNVFNLVAKRGRRIVGFVQLVFHPREDYPYSGFWIHCLGVKVFYRGLGIGEALVREAIGFAARQEAAKIYLLLFPTNQAALRLYRKLGFKSYCFPDLEKQLDEEERSTGRRPIAMYLRL